MSFVKAWLRQRRPHWFGDSAGLPKRPLFKILTVAANQLPRAVVRVGLMYFLHLQGAPDVRAALLRGPGVLRRATPDDIEGLVGCIDRRREFVERFSRGDHCVVCVINDAIVGFQWFSDLPTHVESRFWYSIEIPEGYVYSYDAFVDPRYRNSGVWLRSYAHIFALMRDRGKLGVVTFVDHGNWTSLRAHLKLGFTLQRQVLAIRLGAWPIFKARPIPASLRTRESASPPRHETGTFSSN